MSHVTIEKNRETTCGKLLETTINVQQVSEKNSEGIIVRGDHQLVKIYEQEPGKSLSKPPLREDTGDGMDTH